MKAIVLAGGHATRLWPLTKNRAKPLLPLAGKPIIAYVLDELERIDAVDDVLISTNAKFDADFQRFLAEHDYDKARIVVEDHTNEEQKIGSLGAVLQIMENEGEDDYFVVGGDNYTTLSLQDFLAFAQEKDAIVTACFELENWEDAREFGVVETDGEQRITGFEEKPEQPSSSLISTAFYFFPRSSRTMFDDYVNAHRGSGTNYLDEPGRLIEWAHTRYDLYAYPFTGAWYDIGTPENYLTAQAALGNNYRKGTVTDSTIGDNVCLMDDAIIERSEVEGCIVFPGAKIRDSTLKRCIIDEEATVSGQELQDAVIGSYSRVQ